MLHNFLFYSRQRGTIYTTEQNGQSVEKIEGAYCEYIEQPNTNAEDYGTFEDYQKVLRLQCDAGDPGVAKWYVHPQNN